MARPLVVETPQGPAHVHVQPAPEARGALVLGHGAAGGVTARDLVTSANVARELGFAVALVEQPYRVAGRRSPPRAPQLDAAWLTIVESLRARRLRGLPLVTGGRSSGARVACRTAAETGARAVLCLAFPVHPPGRLEKTRLDELDGVKVPVFVVQGDRDPFGMPPRKRGRTVHVVEGNHSLRTGVAAYAAAAADWLAERLGSA
jgi:hypothetical protein